MQTSLKENRVDKLKDDVKKICKEIAGEIESVEDAAALAKVYKRLSSALTDITEHKARVQRSIQWQKQLEAWREQREGKKTPGRGPGRPPRFDFKDMEPGEVRYVDWGGDSDMETYTGVYAAMKRTGYKLKMDFDMESTPKRLVITRAP